MSESIHGRELDCIVAHLVDSECCAVVGLSNTGKSTLLRTLCTQEKPVLPPKKSLLIYVDCNRMLDLSEQGFYEAVLRAARSILQERKAAPALLDRLEEAYSQIIEPRNPLAVPLGFNNAVEGLCDAGSRVALVLDEFDAPYEALDGRTFLNLRALRDRYQDELVYVTATVRTLDELRAEPETDEFTELFAGRTCRLGALDESATKSVAVSLAEEDGITLTERELDFVARSTGGHPGLLNSVVRLLVNARTTAPRTYERMSVDLIAEAMTGNDVVHGECQRLWDQLTSAERRGILALARREPLAEAETRQLHSLGLTDEDGNILAGAFASFALGRGERVAGLPWGVWVDEDAGEVYVGGQRAPTFTDLEYRLLHVLYERKDKLCDKYRLVEGVWGESYIDEVDDARVEKLVSRVRAKIEEDPANPQYLVTVRGRGYRLLSRPDERGT